MMYRKTTLQSHNAQAATELAIFGAVLVFLIGSIVRNSLISSQQQNLQLKAMRMALLQSYKGSQAMTTGRSSSSVMYYEDRLSPDLNKYGNNDRTMIMASGGGTLTNLLYYPLDDIEQRDSRNFSVSDIYINGIHLPLTTAGIVNDRALLPPAGYSASYSGSPTAIMPVLPNGLTRYRGWNFRCLQSINTVAVPPVETWFGCPLFYNVSTVAGDYGMLTEDEAFDLNRNDIYTDDAPTIGPVNGKLGRTQMAWHWKAVDARDLEIDIANSTNTSFDLDNDGYEEQIIAHSVDANHIESVVTYKDNEEGDIDGSREIINGRAPGLQKEMSIMTQMHPGTFFEVKEGKFYNPENNNNKQWMRSVNFKDQAELVQRLFQLTKDTQRFCSNGVVAATLPDGSLNPVEACGSGGLAGKSTCFNADKIKLMCFDKDSLMLYIRTRVLDKSGHAWLTDVKGALPK